MPSKTSEWTTITKPSRRTSKKEAEAVPAAETTTAPSADASSPQPKTPDASTTLKNLLGVVPLDKQQQQIDQVKKQEHRALPADVDYATIATLSKEAREKLNSIQPLSLGQAGRIPGVSPADVTALLLWLELRKRQNSSSQQRAVNLDPAR